MRKKYKVKVVFTVFSESKEDAFNTVKREIQGLLNDAGQYIEDDFSVGEPEEIAAVESEAPPVCSHCNDTHEVTHVNMSGNKLVVVCPWCPVPCEKCRQPGGAFCQHTPCSCSCHNSKWKPITK